MYALLTLPRNALVSFDGHSMQHGWSIRGPSEAKKPSWLQGSFIWIKPSLKVLICAEEGTTCVGC